MDTAHAHVLDRFGSCVTSADVSIGGAQLYER
jgi:hypothetical protein